MKDPAAEDGKKAKRRKGIGASGELLLLAQTARQQLTQLLKAERDSQDRTMSALFESVGEKRIAELERQAREKLIGPGDSVFVAGQEPVGLGKEMADLVVGGFVVDGGVLAVSLQPPGTEVEFHNVSLVKEEAGEGPGKVERGESSGQIRGAKGSKKRKAMEGGEDGDGPRAKKQRSSHLQIRQAVRAQMPVKPNKEVSRGVEVAGGAPGGTEPMWSEKWWLEKWKKEEKAAKAARAQGEDGASSGEDVPIGRALMNKGKSLV